MKGCVQIGRDLRHGQVNVKMATIAIANRYHRELGDLSLSVRLIVEAPCAKLLNGCNEDKNVNLFGFSLSMS